MSKVRGQKRELEKVKRERAAAKRERRQSRPTGDESAESADALPESNQDEVLAALAALHHQFAEGDVTLEDFEERRDDLVQRLRVD